jgi:phosphoribosyl 1,2-cyclic phosphodiesterase
MKLCFLGTRGEIDARTERHYRHTSLLVRYYRTQVMIDCGADWLGKLVEIKPDAVVLTHAHPDHANGLSEGANCPVYATAETLDYIKAFPIKDRREIRPREPFSIGRIEFEAFAVEHSTRCPAVGFRVAAGRPSIFYSPDVVYIHERAEALRDVRLYVGDGAALERSMVRKRGDRLIGHAPVRTQLTWCEKENVPEALVTHCGSQIVAGDEDEMMKRLQTLADERGQSASIAYDGLERTLR